MNRILALQRLTCTSSLPGFESTSFEETFLMSTVSGICGVCSNGLPLAGSNEFVPACSNGLVAAARS